MDGPGRQVCEVCGAAVGGHDVVHCTRCRSPHHLDCWAYLGHCSNYSCHLESSQVGADRDAAQPAWLSRDSGGRPVFTSAPSRSGTIVVVLVVVGITLILWGLEEGFALAGTALLVVALLVPDMLRQRAHLDTTGGGVVRSFTLFGRPVPHREVWLPFGDIVAIAVHTTSTRQGTPAHAYRCRVEARDGLGYRYELLSIDVATEDVGFLVGTVWEVGRTIGCPVSLGGALTPGVPSPAVTAQGQNGHAE